MNDPQIDGHQLPSIAVVIPCFNSEKYISTAIKSALGQNYPRLQVIVADDGSTDRSVEVIRSFGDAVRLEMCPHKGACHARNRGARVTDAEYVLFLDADDYFHGDYLLQLSQATAAGADVVVGAVAAETDGQMGSPHTLVEQQGGPSFLSLYVEFMIQTSGFLWRREFLLAHGGWNESLPIFQDIELGIRMLLNGPRIVNAELTDAWAVWVQHGAAGRITTSMTRKKAEATLWVLCTHKAGLVAQGPAETRALARRLYWHAGVAFATGHVDIGRKALVEARSLGVKLGGDGSLANRLAVAVLGLEWKTRLAALSYRVFPRKRPYPHNLAG